MLVDYKDSQKKFYDEITHSVLNGNISHAYFIETMSFAGGKDIALSFAKFLLCNKHKVDSDCNDGCNICSLIDNNTYSNLIVVEPDGMWIKKEQLANVKEKFSEKSFDGNYQIYIINHADKLNKASANSILKFLEEPEEGIIAILVADNRYSVLNTILSRCQIYSLDNTTDEDIIDIGKYLDFLMNIEREGKKTICYTQNLWHELYKTKEEYIYAFDNLEKLLLEILNYKIKKETKYLDYKNDFDFICNKNTELDISKKISVITNIKSLMQFNANLNLLIDRFIIEYCEVKK